MKRLLLFFSIAAGLTITGCGSGESDHTHGEDTHTHETEQHAHDDMEAGHEHEGVVHTHDTSEATGTTSHTHAEGEESHSHTGEETHSHDGEESGSGTMLGLNETYDHVRKGVRLTLSYNSDTGTFSGSIENTTQEALPQVSAAVELSNGTELGPTSPVDLAAGESQSIELDAGGETFESWSAHSEIGNGGHSHGEKADHEH